MGRREGRREEEKRKEGGGGKIPTLENCNKTCTIFFIFTLLYLSFSIHYYQTNDILIYLTCGLPLPP